MADYDDVFDSIRYAIECEGKFIKKEDTVKEFSSTKLEEFSSTKLEEFCGLNGIYWTITKEAFCYVLHFRYKNNNLKWIIDNAQWTSDALSRDLIVNNLIKKLKEMVTMEQRISYSKLYSNIRYGISSKPITIEKVIFNDPVTVIIWSDGDKTIVKCAENEKFDPEKGMAIAVAKKFLGTNESKSNFNDIFKKWLPKKPKPVKKTPFDKCMNPPVFTGEHYNFLSAKEIAELEGISIKKVYDNIHHHLYPGATRMSGKWVIPYPKER